MKKLLILALALVMALSLAACGGNETSSPSGSGTTAPGASQPGQADKQNENSLINAPDEAWFSSTTKIAYVFLTDGKYESYSLIDEIWESNGGGTYKLNADSLTIDSTTHPVSVTNDTLTFTIKNKDYVYERISPFNPDNPDPSNSNSEYHGNTDGAADLKNVTDKNYKEVAKSVFGIDVKDVTGLELKKAESLNGVNDLVITYSGSDQDAKATLEYYFEKCKDISSDGVYSVNVNWENYSVSKGTKYEEFEAFYGTEATEIGTLYQCKWVYDNNGSNVQLAISIDDQTTTLTFGLLG